MNPFVCSSNPMSPLNCARREYYSARIRLGMAKDKSSAMRDLNKARAALRRMIYGEAERPVKSFDSSAAGIPCGVVVTGCDEYEIDFILIDRRGYRAKWLEFKCTDEDTARIEREILEWVEGEK